MSFQDTFTKDETKDEVQYDDSAFYTFAATLLLVIILPLLYSIIKRLFKKEELLNNKKYKNCQCSTCKERIRGYYKKIHRKNFNFWFYFMIILVIALSYLFYLSYFEIVKHGGDFKTFDPFEILEISREATESEIKKAYRSLSRKYHPDKNRNNPQAKAKFIIITKAYEALTDEVARKNFELYGNPDGPGSMRLAVGLPSFVLNKKNHMPILILFLLIIVVVIPAFVWFWFTSSQQYDESGMLVGNSKIFYEFLNENILLKQMPFVLGAAMDFNKLKIRPEEAQELTKLYKQYSEYMPKHKEDIVPYSNKKAICMFYAYIYGHNFTSAGLEEDMDLILKNTPLLLTNMYQMSVQLTQWYYQMQMMGMGMTGGQKIKNFGYNCIKTIIEFSQMIHQKLAIKSSPFLQLPHITEAKIKNLNLKKINTIDDFINYVNGNKEKLVEANFTSQEIEDIQRCGEFIPKYEFKKEVFVEGFEEILIEDFITIKATVIRTNLNEGCEIGVPHSNKFPELFKEKVSVLITHDTKIIFETLLDIERRVTTHEFKHLAREAGIFKFKIEFNSLNYKGLDYTEDLEITILKSSDKRKEFIKSIEKREVKKLEPSLFQQMISSIVPYQDDEEEEEEEEEETNDKTVKNHKKETEQNDDDKKDQNPEDIIEGKTDENINDNKAPETIPAKRHRKKK